MLDTARDDNEFAGLDPNFAFVTLLAKVHPEAPFHDQEHLVLVFVMMPGKGALELDQLQVLPVELTGNAGIPMIADERKLFGQINFVHDYGVRRQISSFSPSAKA